MKPKIAIFAPNFSKGGIERICFTLVAELSNTILLDTITHNAQVFRDNVSSENLNLIQIESSAFYKLKIFTKLHTILKLREYFQETQPTVVITFKSPLTAVLAKLISNHKPKLIVRESNSVLALRGNILMRFIKKRVKRFVYSKADCVVALCQEMRTELITAMNVQADKIRVIYNPTVFKDLYQLKQEPVNHPWLTSTAQIPVITASGRFDQQKDFNTLIRAFANVVAQNPCRLILIGDGVLRKQILTLAEQLNIGSHIYLTGFIQNPYKYITKSTIFVLSSRYEGLANALIEAQACGVPTIATTCPTSPSEILMSGEAGLLVPVGDHKKLANAIMIYLGNETIRQQHQQVAQVNLDRFDATINSKKYLNLARELTS